MTTYTTYICDICGVESRKQAYSMSTLPALRRINGNCFEEEVNKVQHLCDTCWKNALNALNTYYEFIDGAKVNRVARYKETVDKSQDYSYSVDNTNQEES